MLCFALIGRLQQKGINTILLSGDREEAVATIANKVGIESEFINASMTPQRKSEVISSLQAAGHRVAMVTFIYIFMSSLVPSKFNFNLDKTIYQ